MSIKVNVLPVTAYQQNCSVIMCEATNKAAFVDPGGQADDLIALAESMGASIDKIIITHGHLDHAGAAAELAKKLGVKIVGPHKDDQYWLDGLEDYAQMMSFPPTQNFLPDQWLEGGDVIEVGQLKLEVKHCPGHTPGHVVLFHKPSKLAWVGDVLFQGSIGRTDFPGGDHQTLIDSITKQLWPLGDDVTFIPGHGPTSTFGQERQTNPFVADTKFG